MKRKFLAVAAVLIALVSMPVLAQQTETQTFTSEDGSFTFDYPTEWIVDTTHPDLGPNAPITVTNLPFEEVIQSPAGVVLIISPPAKSYNMGLVSGKTPRDAVAQSLQPFGFSQQQPAVVDFSTPSADGTPQPLQIEPAAPPITEFLVDGRPAAYGYSTLQAMGTEVSQLFIAADLGDDYWVILNASSVMGGLVAIQAQEAVILRIVQSMRYTPPAAVYSGNPDLPQVYSGEIGFMDTGRIQFYYPADWNVVRSGFLLFSNKQQNLLNTAPETGQFIAVIHDVSETLLSAGQMDSFTKCGTPDRIWTAREVVAQMLGNITPAQLEQNTNAGITLTQPEVVTVNDIEIVYLRVYQADAEQLLMFIDLGDGNVVSMQVSAKLGEMAQFEDQLFAVIGTFQYTPSPCDVTPTPGQG